LLIPDADDDAEVVEAIRVAEEFCTELDFGADTLDLTTLVSIIDKGKQDSDFRLAKDELGVRVLICGF
jgi:hypothetical protein